MSRSFQIVESKVRESLFFLDKLEETKDYLGAAQFYLSAFLSATRSITFTIQASLNGLPDFENWYEEIQNQLKSNVLARYFLFARNHSQKVGFYPIEGGYFVKDENGNSVMKMIFSQFYPPEKGEVPEEDVIAACNHHFSTLLKIVQTCYKRYGPWIDTNIRYTIEGMNQLNMSIEQVEEENGFPYGYTAMLENIEDRLTPFRTQCYNPGIDDIFIRFFKEDRLSNKV